MVSTTMSSEQLAVLSALSLNSTKTAFEPSPEGRLHDVDVAYGSHAVQGVLSSMNLISTTSPSASVAARFKVTS